MKTRCNIIRIDPEKRAFTAMHFEGGRSFVRPVCKILRCKRLGHKYVCDVDGIRLYVAADAEAATDLPGFRFRGSSDSTAGLAILFGQGPNGGMVDSPADIEWVRRRLIWLEAKDMIDPEPGTTQL